MHGPVIGVDTSEQLCLGPRSKSCEDVWQHESSCNTTEDVNACHVISGSCWRREREGVSGGRSSTQHHSNSLDLSTSDDEEDDVASEQGEPEEPELTYCEWVSRQRPVPRPPGLPRPRQPPPRRTESAPCFGSPPLAASPLLLPLAQLKQLQPSCVVPVAACNTSWADDDLDEECDSWFAAKFAGAASWFEEEMSILAATPATSTSRCCAEADAVMATEMGMEVEVQKVPTPVAAQVAEAAEAMTVLLAADALSCVSVAVASSFVVHESSFSCPGVASLVIAAAAGGSSRSMLRGRRAVATHHDTHDEEDCDVGDDDDDNDDTCSEPTSPAGSDCGVTVSGGGSIGSEGSSRNCSSLSLSSWDTQHSLTEEELEAEVEAMAATARQAAGLGSGMWRSPSTGSLNGVSAASGCGPVAAAMLMELCGDDAVAFAAAAAAAASGDSSDVLAAAVTFGCGGGGAAPVAVAGASGAGSAGGARVPLPVMPVVDCWEADAWERQIEAKMVLEAGAAKAGEVQEREEEVQGRSLPPLLVCYGPAAAASAAECGACEAAVALAGGSCGGIAAVERGVDCDDVDSECECPSWLEPHLGLLLGQVVAEALWGAEGDVGTQ